MFDDVPERDDVIVAFRPQRLRGIVGFDHPDAYYALQKPAASRIHLHRADVEAALLGEVWKRARRWTDVEKTPAASQPTHDIQLVAFFLDQRRKSVGRLAQPVVLSGGVRAQVGRNRFEYDRFTPRAAVVIEGLVRYPPVDVADAEGQAGFRTTKADATQALFTPLRGSAGQMLPPHLRGRVGVGGHPPHDKCSLPSGGRVARPSAPPPCGAASGWASPRLTTNAPPPLAGGARGGGSPASRQMLPPPLRG